MWILGGLNKAAECISRLVEPPHDRQATVQMISATNHDVPTFHTIHRTTQHNIAEDLTPQLETNTFTPDITKITDTPDAMAKLLTEDRLQTLLQMQMTDPFCKCISKHLSNGKAPNHEADLFLHIKGLLYKHVTDSNQKFLGSCHTKTMEIHSAHGST